MAKTKKQSAKELIFEIIAEIALTFIALAIGLGIFKLFGAKNSFLEKNEDLAILIGLFALFVSIAIIVKILTFLFGERKPCHCKKHGLDIILDTDVGADCDDMMALAYLVYAKRNLGVNIKAITHSNSCENGIPAIRAFFKNLGEDAPEIGHNAAEIGCYDNYAKAVAERFGDEACFAPSEDAVTVMRRALTDSYDAIILAVGPMTNVAALLNSTPDEISSLDGISLVRERCKKIVLMAGDFESEKPEWNVKLDIPAMQTVMNKSPVPIALIPFETGYNMISGKFLLEEKNDSALSLSFKLFPGTDKLSGRHSWDPCSAVYAVMGENDLLCESAPLTVTVDDNGRTIADYEKSKDHYIIKVRTKNGESEAEAKKRVAKYIDDCARSLYTN